MPEDAAGDWFYHFTEIFTSLITLIMILLLRKKYESSVDNNYDTCQAYYFIILSFILALIIHPSISDYFVLY